MDTLISPAAQSAAMKADRELFRLSSLVDVLRDNAQSFLELHAAGLTSDPKLAQDMVGRYGRLRSAVADVLADDDSTFLEQWTTTLTEGASIAELYDAAAALARYIDTVINTDAYVATRFETRTKIGQLYKDAGITGESETKTGAGQYL